MATKRKKKTLMQGTPTKLADREASGRPLVSYSIAAETRDAIVQLAGALKLSRGRVIDAAIAAFSEKAKNN